MQVEISAYQSKILNQVISSFRGRGSKPPFLDSLALDSLGRLDDTLMGRVERLYSSSSQEVGFLASGGKLFHHEHSQWWSDCQLVTATNAAIFLGLPTLSPHLDCKAYKAWVRYTGTLKDGTINEDRIAQMHRHLRIRAVRVPCTLPRIKQELARGYPVELSLQWEDAYDTSHSVLVVDVKGNKIQATNSCHGADGWEAWSAVFARAKTYGTNCCHDGKPLARSFRPIGKCNKVSARWRDRTGSVE